MKALGPHVTFVRRSGPMKQHIQRHERAKPYVCCECPADELKRH